MEPVVSLSSPWEPLMRLKTVKLIELVTLGIVTSPNLL